MTATASVRWLTPPNLGLRPKPASRARIGRVAEEAAKRLRKKASTVHGWLHSEFDGPQHRVAGILEVAYEWGDYELAGKVLRPILAVHAEPRDLADEMGTIGALVEQLHQLLYELSMWAFHKRNGPQIAKLIERSVCQMLWAAAALAHYDGGNDR